MTNDSDPKILTSFLLRRRGGYTGLLHVFNRGLLIWSETTKPVRATAAMALIDAQSRKLSLIGKDGK